MKIRQNLHIHSLHSCDSACATINDIQKEMQNCNMIEYGLSDHYHTTYNLCDIHSAYNDFHCCKRPNEFHFGIELTCMAKWECDAIKAGNFEYLGDDPIYGLRYNQPPQDADFSPYIDLDEEMIKKFGIEYTIAGTHWPLQLPNSLSDACDDLFTQMMYLAEHPLVDILAHPWYPLQVAHSWKDWQGLGSLPKFDPSIVDFSVLTKIPQWMNEQIGAALVKNGTCAEINSAVLNEYRCPSEYRHARWKILALWREMGVKFTFGTDLHAAHTVNADIAATELLLDLYGFNEDDILYGFPKKRKAL